MKTRPQYGSLFMMLTIALLLSACQPLQPLSAQPDALASERNEETEAYCQPLPKEETPDSADRRFPTVLELIDPDELGQQLILTGIVTTDEGIAVEGAFITMWHANPEGEYRSHRGTVMTDANGRYQVITLLPGSYHVEEAQRAAHVHFNLGGVGIGSESGEILFEGDPNLEVDPVLLEMDPKILAERIIALHPLDDGSLCGTFDISVQSRN